MWQTNLRVLAVALLVIGFYTMIAHLIPQLESEVPEALVLTGDVTPEALAEAGERVYNGAGGCIACHGLGSRAPELLTDHAGQGPIGSRCGTREEGVDCKAYLYESLTEPGAFLVGGFDNIMPDMRRQLAEDQIWALVAYLESQGGEVTVTAADLPAVGIPGAENAPGGSAAPAVSATTDPRELLREKGCIGCHAIDGAGPALGPSFDGIGSRITAERIRRGILQPNADTAAGFAQFAGTMPLTFGRQLSAEQLEAIVSFLGARR